MALRLNQVIALSKTAKTQGENALTLLYHSLQKSSAPLSGIARTYQPRDDDGEKLPPEATLLQVRSRELMAQAAPLVARQVDIVATLDSGNQRAGANVVLDGEVVLENVPATTLIFLEKKLDSVIDTLGKLPVLDASESWTFDSSVSAYRTDPVQTVRTKKVPRNHVKAEATDKHPAQVELYYEDTVVGTWSTTKFSGAVSAAEKRALLTKASQLREAVKVAREEANGITVDDVKLGDKVIALLGW